MSAGFSAAVVTVSDRSAQGERVDASGPRLVEALTDAGFEVRAQRVVPDESEAIQACLRELCDTEGLALVLTTGGTGFAPRDVTPEATRAVIEREAPGLAEHARAATVSQTKFAILSRGVAGIRGNTLVVNLPGSPKGARQTFEALSPVLPHALSVLVHSTQDHDE